MNRRWSWLAVVGPALTFANVAVAQYAPPVQLPDVAGAGNEDFQRVVGLAVDGSGGGPYPAAFLFEYVTDGSPGGTRLIGNLPNSISDVGAIPGAVGAYMIASGNTPEEFNQLFYTDGSDTGTHIIAELVGAFPEGIRKIHGFVQNSVVVETQSGRLAESDGTLAGTFTILPGGAGSGIESITFGQTQGFVHAYNAQGSHIWRFALASSDTIDITPSVPPPFYSFGLTAFGDRACFAAGESQVGAGLYCTDGTAAGTSLIGTGSNGEPLGLETETGFQRFGSKLYLVPVWKPSPTSPETYKSPWSTDGTVAGTHSLVVNSTMEQDRIGTAQGHVFFSGHLQGTGMPFSISDGTSAGTVEIVRPLWSVVGSYRGDLLNPEFGSAAFLVSAEFNAQSTDTQIQRTDGSAAGTFPLPPPDSLPAADWQPSTDCKPALVGRYLLVCNSGMPGGIWSYDLDPIFGGGFD